MKLRKYFRGQVGPHQINFGSPHNLLGGPSGTHSSPATSLARCPTAGGPLKAPGSAGINGVKSCILAISWQQNWPFRNYNLIQMITNFQNIFLKIKLFYIHQYTPFLWYRGFYDTAVFILSVPMHCSATRRFFYLYIHKHNSHIYRNVWSFCPNVLNFCKYTYFFLFLRNSGHFYFTLIPCFVKCSIIKP